MQREIKKAQYLVELLAVCFLLGVEARGCWGVRMEKLKIIKHFFKLNEYSCSVVTKHNSPFFGRNNNELLEPWEMCLCVCILCLSKVFFLCVYVF